MPKRFSHPIFEYLWPVLTFLILIFYSTGFLFLVPYIGLRFNPGDGQVMRILIEKQSSLQEDDKLLQVGAIPWDRYSQDLHQPLFAGSRPGDTVMLRVLRSGREITIPWEMPGLNRGEVIDRLDMHWLPYVFWLAGTFVLLFLRPRDIRRQLLVAFNYLTALWLLTGIISVSHALFSAVILRMAIWMCIPVYLHLHWVYPSPLGKFPARLLPGLYLFAGVMAVLEWLQWLPKTAYFLGIMVALIGSLALLIAHAFLRPEDRRDLILLLLAVGIFILPTIALSVARLVSDYPWYGGGALLALPAIPVAYTFAVYRRQLGGLELRANRGLAFLLFGVLLFVVLILVLSVSSLWIQSLSIMASLAVVLALLAGMAGAAAFPAFQRWVERNILGIPLPPTHLLQSYASRITTSLETGRLIGLVRDEILPSLLIRQAALIRLGSHPHLVFTLNVSGEQLPGPAEIPAILSQTGSLRVADEGEDPVSPCPWARLVLPMIVHEQVIGLFLLGRRDPDDYYAPTEIPALQALADQTAIALLNIDQADNLSALIQVDIERQEIERKHLALDLHDHVLNKLAILAMNVDESQANPQFWSVHKDTVSCIRELIAGLRPRMLSYGLRKALDELVDEIKSQAEKELVIEIDVPPSDARYPEAIELHIYRIVQQACQNTIKHAQARHLWIQGWLEPEDISLSVRDDGTGFETNERLDLARLLADRHFGLAGIYERAAFIGAKIEIGSQPGQGTQVKVIWRGVEKEKA